MNPRVSKLAEALLPQTEEFLSLAGSAKLSSVKGGRLVLCRWMQELDGAKYGQAPLGPASKQDCLHAVPLAELSSTARWVCLDRVATPERAGGVEPRFYCKGGCRALLERFDSWSPLPENV